MQFIIAHTENKTSNIPKAAHRNKNASRYAVKWTLCGVTEINFVDKITLQNAIKHCYKSDFF